MAEVSAWVVGPAGGMYVTARQGILPPSMRKVNKHDVPVTFVVVQGPLVSGWAAVLTFGGGGGNVSFFTATSLTVVIYLVAYLLFFIAYLVLVLRKKDLDRAYNIPGGTPVKVAVAVIGFVISLAALGISFVTPSNLPKAEDGEYTMTLAISFVVVLLIPFVIYALHDKKKHLFFVEPKRLRHHEVNKWVPPQMRGEHVIQAQGEDVLGQDGPDSGAHETPASVKTADPAEPAST